MYLPLYTINMHLCLFSKSKFNSIWSIKSDRVNLVEPASPCGTVQTWTGKVDSARKFKCTTVKCYVLSTWAITLKSSAVKLSESNSSPFLSRAVFFLIRIHQTELYIIIIIIIDLFRTQRTNGRQTLWKSNL